MNPNEIYQDVLMVDKSIIIEFESLKQLNSFKTGLHIARARMERQLKQLGLLSKEDCKLSIYATLVSSNTRNPPFSVKFCMKGKEAPRYKILSIEDNEPDTKSDD